MIFRFLFIFAIVCILFYPAFRLINFLYIKFNIIKDKELVDEYNKVENKRKDIKNEVKERIDQIEKEKEQLKEIERN